MHASNVITFTGRQTKPGFAASLDRATVPGDVIVLASWFGRAIPHRTPTGVFFSTRATPPSPCSA